MTRHAGEIKGKQVVSLAEGRDLGRTSGVYLAPGEGRIFGLAVKKSRLRGEEYWLAAEHIEHIGDDFVFTPSAEHCRRAKPRGRNLWDMLGLEVTSLGGKLLGTLEDVEVDEGWNITALDLSGKKYLEINSGSDTFGRDAIIVGADAERRLSQRRDGDGRGVFARLFLGESIFEAADRLTRKGKPAPSQRRANEGNDRG